jgi:transcriptional regulator with XRE-family HTH domain
MWNQKKQKNDLGKAIVELRKKCGLSQRKMALEIGIANSNLKYIEDGINAPSAVVFEKMIEILQPDQTKRMELDSLYSQIRGTPPPEICRYLIENSELYEIFRSNPEKLNKKQIEMITETVVSD